jgi:hypothetical protein
MQTAIQTDKKPRDLVLGQNGQLFIVDDNGQIVPHERPHRRAQREAAEAFRRRHGWTS